MKVPLLEMRFDERFLMHRLRSTSADRLRTRTCATMGQRGNGRAGRIADAMDDEAETAGVALPPPLLFAGALALGLTLGRLQGEPEKRARFARTLGGASVVAGLALGAAAIAALKRAGTNLDLHRHCIVRAFDARVYAAADRVGAARPARGKSRGSLFGAPLRRRLPALP